MLLSWVAGCAALFGECIFEIKIKITTGGLLTDTQRSWLEKGRDRCDAFRSSGKRHIFFFNPIYLAQNISHSQNLVK